MTKRYTRTDLTSAMIVASKSMIRVKDPIVLMRLITRFIDRQIGATHVAVLLHEKPKHSYVLIDSKGEAGQKIPIGYIRVKDDSAMISYFNSGLNVGKRNKFHRKEAIVLSELEHIKNFEILVNRKESMAIAVDSIKKQMNMFRAAVCVPAYYKHELVAVLMLGNRLDDKSYDDEELKAFSTLANDVAMAVTNAGLIKDLTDSLEREHELLVDTASALSSAIDARDRYTRGHSERVAHYTLVIAAEMINRNMIPFSREFLEAAQLTGLLHDVGKIGIKDEILNKPSQLTFEEFTTMKEHVNIGINILKPIKGMKEIADGAKYHHERWDGSGYPFNLKGTEIPLLGRIVCVADSYDTMVTSRPYQKGRTPKEAFEELQDCAGKQFDQTVVDIFLDLWKSGAIKKRNYKDFKFTQR